MKKGEMTPTKLRVILVVALLLLVVAGVFAFTYGHTMLSKYSDETKQKAAEATASDSSLQYYKETEKALAAQGDVIDRAGHIVAESKSYIWQDQFTADITTLARNAGIEITSINFTPVSTASTAATSTPASSGAAGPSRTDGAAGATPGAAGGTTSTAPVASVRSMGATVALKNPIPYPRMLTFIHTIEQSLTKMKIKSISLSKASESAGMISSDSLQIEVYVN